MDKNNIHNEIYKTKYTKRNIQTIATIATIVESFNESGSAPPFITIERYPFLIINTGFVLSPVSITEATSILSKSTSFTFESSLSTTNALLSGDKKVKSTGFTKPLAIPLSSKPSFLNSYAWRMSELEINLDDALLKSTQSVKIIDSLGGEMVSSIPMFLDTKAEILWKMNRVSDALNISCISS